MSRASARKTRDRKTGNSGNRVLKWVMITGTIFLFLILVAGLGLKMWLKSYRESEGFRNAVTGKVAELLRSEVEVTSFKWEDQSVYADGFSARGYEDAAHSRLQLDGMRASFGGIADQAWQIPEVTLNRMNLEFSKDRLRGDFAGRRSDSSVSPASKAASVPGWLQRFIPTKFVSGDIRIDAANLKVLGADSTETFGLQSVQAVLRQSSGGYGWEIEGRRGEMQIAGQPEMDIDRFSVRWQRDEVFINEVVVDVYDGAQFSANGSVAFPAGSGTDLDLRLKIANLDVTKVVGPNWEKKISGVVRGDIHLTGRVGSAAGLKQEGTLHLREGVLSSLPVLDKIAKYTRNKRFERLALNETTAEFEKLGDRIVLQNLVVQSDGLSRLEGNLTIDGRAIDGNFRLGVTPGTLSWIPGAERKVFTESEKGFLWTHVRVAGTLDDPREDLSARLGMAAATAIVEEAPRKAIDAARKTLENPAQTPSNVIEQGRKMLDTLVPLLP